MRLTILTPQSVLVDEPVRHVRAEDASGAFGILHGHADMLTALDVSVLVYRDVRENEHFVAVRAGLLAVRGRNHVEVTTREAVANDDLALLERDVLERFRRTDTLEAKAHRGLARLEGTLLRRLTEYFRLEQTGSAHGRGSTWGR